MIPVNSYNYRLLKVSVVLLSQGTRRGSRVNNLAIAAARGEPL